jgi:DNA-binding CsgD family transcriptional regulator
MEGSAEGFLAAASDVMTVLENLPLPSALLDVDGTVRWQNKASIELRGDRTGFEFAQFIAPADRAAARAVFKRLLSHEDSAELMVQALTVEREYVRLDGRWSSVRLRDGRKAVIVMNMGDLPGPGAASGVELTARQLQVLRLLSRGRSTAEIADELSLHPTTVRNHIANLITTLGVHSRLQAVIEAQKAGLIDP